MAATAGQIKYPKPDRFHGDLRSYQSWITDVELYFDSYNLTGDEEKIRYTLALLTGAASDWKKDYITQHRANLGAYQDFRAALDQSFQPIQHAEEAHRKLARIRQNGSFIDEYIAAFSVLSSEAGLTDGAPLRQYFKDGLDSAVRHEAIRQNPTTINEWKTAARNAYSIVRDINESRNKNLQPYRRDKKIKNGNRRRFNPRYEDITRQPVTHRYRNEWDMEVDNINHIINNIASQDGDNYDSLSESEDSDDSDRQEDSEDEVNYISRQASSSKKRVPTSNDNSRDVHRAINFIIANLAQDKNARKKFDKCFWCNKPGHYFAECNARKAYMAEGKIHQKQNTRSKGKSSKGKKPQRPLKSSGSRTKKFDPYAMIHNILNQEDSSDEEDSDGNF